MRAVIRQAAVRVAPGFMADRGRHYERGVRQRIGITNLAEQTSAKLGSNVLDGPFVGMKLPPGWESTTTSPVLMLLGLFEAPLHDAIEAAISRQPRRVANIGCGEGYYAVGLALRLPYAHVFAYDIARSQRAATARMAHANHVSDRVSIRSTGKTSAAELVVCDIEGAEAALFTPAAIAELASATVIVECHDSFVPGVTDHLKQAFERTHDVEPIHDEPRARPPALDWMTDQQSVLALDEMRADQQAVWLVATPKLL